jgi:DNA-binding MarR family transcriptional regulator
MKQDVVMPDDLAAALSNRLFFRLYQCANLLHKTGTRALEAHHITTQQWAIIGALADRRNQGGIAVGDLAARLMVSRQNLSGVLSRLSAQNLVERVVAEADNRSRLIRLTAAGHALWQGIQAPIASYYAEALKGFTTSDMIHALHYLDNLRANFHEIDTAQGEAAHPEDDSPEDA